jgi:hypothetical protein
VTESLNDFSNVITISAAVIDSINPNVTINQPLNQSYTTTAINFNVTAVDDDGVSDVYYTLNGGADNISMSNLSTSPTQWTASNGTMQQGSTTVIYYSNDTNNNLNWTENVSFFIDSVNPVVTVIYPDNNTNHSDASVDVNFTVSDSNLAVCSWDNDSFTDRTIIACFSGLSNITNITWSEGIHNVTVYANDSSGNEGRASISFTIDSTGPSLVFTNQIIKDNQSLSHDVNASDATVVESFVIDDTGNFSINIASGVLINNTNLIIFNYTLNISVNDSWGNLNSELMSVEVQNGSVVASSTPSPSTGSGESGGGGGGAGSNAGFVYDELVIDKEIIEVTSVSGAVEKRFVELYNKGDKKIRVNVRVKELLDIVYFDDDNAKFELEAGERKVVEFLLYSPEKSGVYVGKVLFNGNEVLVTLNVNSKELLFDARITIPDSFKIIDKGDKLESQIILIPMADDSRVDVTLEYEIKDFDGQTHLKESETMLIDQQRNFRKTFDTRDLESGKYILALSLVYNNGVATSSDYFEISKNSFGIQGFNIKEISSLSILNIVIVAGIVILISTISIVMIRYKRVKIFKKGKKARKRKRR